jgi:hypothetical protein
MPGGPLLELMQGQDMQALISACNACTTGTLILRTEIFNISYNISWQVDHYNQIDAASHWDGTQPVL